MVKRTKSEIIYFHKAGPENTNYAINYAFIRAKKGDIRNIVVATSSGDTGLKVVNKFSKTQIRIIPVWLNAGSPKSQTKQWKMNKKKFDELGIKGVQGIQAFSGIERAIFKRWNTALSVMLLSDTLRIFCEGVKVGIEIAIMACDAGLIPNDKDVMTISGTSKGADTVMIVKPSYSDSFFNSSIKEIICKPITSGIEHEAR